VLTSPGNDFTGVVELSGGAVSVVDNNSLVLGTIDASSLYAKGSTIGLSGDVETTGIQEYDGAVRLEADVALTAGGHVGFASTVDVAHQLSVQARDAVVVGGAVGSNTSLAGLDVDAGTFGVASTIDVTGDLAIAVAAGGIGQAGAFRAGGDASFQTGSGHIVLDNTGNTFAGRVDIQSAGSATIDTRGTTLNLGNVSTAGTFEVMASQIRLGGNVGTVGTQTYWSPV